MYILTRVNFAYEVETEAYHNRTIGQALSYIQGKMKQYLNGFDASEMKELRRITRDFVIIAKNLKDHQSCIYRPEDNEPVAVEMWKRDGRLSVDIALYTYRGELDEVLKLDYIDSNDYVN